MVIKNNKKCNIKINDKNIKPCKYCNNEMTKIYYEDTRAKHRHIIIEDNYLYVIDLERPPISRMERVEINNCPMCGRKLNENGKQ